MDLDLENLRLRLRLTQSELAEIMELDLNRKIQDLSYGNKKKVGIVQGLLHSPKLIILDEPTTGLDPQGIIEVRNLILRLRDEQKKTVLLSSHQLSEIEIIANRMVIINQGRTIVEGNVHELLEKQSMNLEISVANPTVFEETIQREFSSLTARLVYQGTYHIEMEEDIRQPLIQRLVETGCGVKAVIPKRSLEDFFIKMTEK